MPFRASLFLLLLLLLLIPGCGPSNPAAAMRASIQLEERSDGLCYAAESPDPYSGQVAVFSKSNSRLSLENWQDGKPHGPWLRFWSNGQPKQEETFVHGEMVHRLQWYEDGTKKLDAQLRDGVGYGKVRLWWPDGRMRRTTLLVENRKPHGHLLEYAEDGSILTDAIFEQGRYVSGKIRPPSPGEGASGSPEDLPGDAGNSAAAGNPGESPEKSRRPVTAQVP